MKITKGVIAAAGFGTRFLPATKVQPKELLPILEKPIIQYTVEEFYDSGIRTIIIVTGTKNRGMIEEYFDRTTLREYRNKNESTRKLWDILGDCCITFMKQKGPYGNGTPLLSARGLIGENEPVIYAFGDDVVLSEEPFTAQLIRNYERYGHCVVGAQEVAWEDVVKYGILKIKNGSTSMELEDIIEKPSREEAPSNLAIFGRYLLKPAVIDVLEKAPLGKNNEKWLSDALKQYLQKDTITVQTVQDGQWYTTGDPLTFFKTMIQFSLAHQELGKQFREYLRSLQV
ncbi:UTP--glucose-1-phosphate uridylyltransferase [bacterium]|nr:UTP--glucose-1-phosphate uridylyltransferase [candidate division CSSED10-310 bacterium]